MALPSVGICAIFKNEAPYLREWMLFHLIQGVEAFWLYDNGSNDDWRSEIPELAEQVIPWPGTMVQLLAYEDCCRNRADTDWLACIDIDEFLFDEQGRTLNEVLAPVKASRVEVLWQMFGDSAHVAQPRGLTIDVFLRCQAGLHTLGKQIVRPEKVTAALTPHSFDAKGKVASVEGLRLNHYWTRSEAECHMKFNRGRAAYNVRRKWPEFLAVRDELFEDVDARASVLFGPTLREEIRGAT